MLTTRPCPELGCEDGSRDSGGVYPWGEGISIRCPTCDGTGRVSVHVTTHGDVSRYGVNVYEDGYRVLGTWAMSSDMALEKYRKLGDGRKLNNRREFPC